MFVVLQPHQIDKCVALPENGMGYQIVDVTLRNGRQVTNLTLIDSSILELPDDIGNVMAADITDIYLNKGSTGT